MATIFKRSSENDAFNAAGASPANQVNERTGPKGLYGQSTLNEEPNTTGGEGPWDQFGRTLMGKHGFKAGSPTLNTTDFEAQRRSQEASGARQEIFGDYLQRAAMGQAPSAAQGQLMAGRDAAIMAARANAASARGGAAPLAERTAAFSQAGSIQQAARDAGILSAQEQNQYAQLANENVNQQRLAELQNQGLSSEQAIAQLQAESGALTNQTTIAEGTAARGQGILGKILSDMRAKEDVAPGGFGSALSRAVSAAAPAQPVAAAPTSSYRDFTPEAQAAAPTQQKSDDGGLLGGIMGIVSDKRAKDLTQENTVLRSALRKATGTGDDALMAQLEQIDRDTDPKPEKSPDLSTALARALGKVDREATGTVDTSRMTPFAQPDLRGSVGRMPDVEESRANLDAVKPYTYRYKPDVAAAIGEDTGPREGVMAQDLQRSPAYQAAVVEQPNGMLGLDPKRLLSANTAEIGGLDKRLKALEFGPALKRASGY